MTSPTSSLKKTKKVPLPTQGNKSMPFRYPNSAPEIDPSTFISDELRKPYHIDAATHKYILRDTRPRGKDVPSDSDLVSSMALRLATVERELLAAKREVIEKDQYICELETKLEMVSMATATPSALELRCAALQRQIDEMEEFLSDYGMVWVGSNVDEGGGTKPLSEAQKTLWIPDTSVVSTPSYTVDYDVILKNIQELNVLAGEGSNRIVKTTQGAKLKCLDSIPLTLYKNGIVLFQGPFRPFTDPSTQQCIMDLMDGYFPSELQLRFPEGVPFQVTDHRDTVFEPITSEKLFPGAGHHLDEKAPPVPKERCTKDSTEKTTSVLPGPKVPLDQFLRRLPESVVHNGRVIDIRSGIAQTLQSSETNTKVTLVDTPVVCEIKNRMDTADDRPTTPGHMTTIRVKSENGEQTYILKMRYSDTIGDIRRHIVKLRPKDPLPFEIRSSFPSQTLCDDMATLRDCGLFPSANLFLFKPSKLS